MKNILIAGSVLAGSLLSVAVAQEDQPAVDVDQIIALCEDQFNEKKHPEETERNRLIDECIESKLNAGDKRE